MSRPLETVPLLASGQTTSKVAKQETIVATIGAYADYFWESDFGDPPEGWVEVRSGMPGVTRRFLPPKGG